VPKEHRTAVRAAAFDEFLQTLAYPFVEETANPVYRLFLR
jgi:threonine dehydratase